jgi:hypothetical protein
MTPMPASIAVEAITALAAITSVSPIASRLMCAVAWIRDAGACRGIATTAAATATAVTTISFFVTAEGLRT